MDLVETTRGRETAARDGDPGGQRLFADLRLARRVEEGWDHVGVANALTQQHRRPELGAEVLAVGGGHAVFLGPGSPLSQAQGLGLDGPVADEALDAMEHFFKERLTPIQIEVATLADPTLLPALCRRGYEIVEQTHSLVCPRGDHAATPPPGGASVPASGIEIRRVEESAIEAWLDLLLASFFEAPQVPPPALREGAISMAQAPGFTTWVATIDGEAAGGGSLMIHDGLALICGDGTLPGFRSRGVQTALLRARLALAWEAGCDLATICTQPGSGSQRNAERQGFQVAYARTMMMRP